MKHIHETESNYFYFQIFFHFEEFFFFFEMGDHKNLDTSIWLGYCVIIIRSSIVGMILLESILL